MSTLLYFLLGILILVTVHEWGHYRVARACGVAVRRFSIGFGEPIWRWQRGPDDTEFVIARWPLGGYVRMVDESDGEVPAHLLPRAFNRQSLRARAAIVAAGPVANLVFAVLVYAVVAWWGSPQLQPVVATPAPSSLAAQAGIQGGDWVREWQVVGEESPTAVRSLEQLRWLLAQAVTSGDDVELGIARSAQAPVRHVLLPLSQAASGGLDAQALDQVGLGMPWMAARVREVLPEGAAAQAGLLAGDWVRAIDEQAVSDVEDLRQRIRAAVGEQGQARQQLWRVERSGQSLSLTLTPQVVINDEGQAIGRVGVMLGEPPATQVVSAGFWEGVERAFTQTWEVAYLSGATLWRMVSGQAAWSNISGPVGVAQAAGASAAVGGVAFLQFLAFFSVNLAVLNLLPIPLLDGGHLMYYLWEWVSGRAPSERVMRAGQRVGMGLLGLLMFVALSNDMLRLLN